MGGFLIFSSVELGNPDQCMLHGQCPWLYATMAARAPYLDWGLSSTFSILNNFPRISPTMEVANAALPGYCIILLYFVGLLIRKQDQPAYWHWCALGLD